MGPFESTHDEWLEESGFGPLPTAVALKTEIAGRLQARMLEQGMDIHRLANCMATSEAAVQRLLDPGYDVVSLRALFRAAEALNCRLKVELQ